MDYSTLVDATTLFKHINDPDWVIVDCRFSLADSHLGKNAYLESHIPNAFYAHINEDLSGALTPQSGRHPLPQTGELVKKFKNWGISRHKQLIVYDDAGGSMAARLWWLARWLNHSNVALLDGGYQHWISLGLPVSDTLPAFHNTELDTTPVTGLFVDALFVDQVRLDSTHRLIDVRASERFNGSVEPIDKVAGHIPGAINIPWQTNLDKNGKFLGKEQLRTKYQTTLNNTDPSRVIVMCGSGVTACHTLLALEHAGITGAKLYPGSWSEWITNPEHAVSRNM